MAQFIYRSGSSVQVQNELQPRPLTRWDPARACSWTACAAQAVSKHKGESYCARHLLTTLQHQWQE